MKSKWWIVVTVCLLLALAGCGEKKPPEPLPPDPNGGEDPAPTKLVRADEDGLLQIIIEDGHASILYDLERWDELHNIYDVDTEFFNVDNLADGPYPIGVEAGRVKDACIGKVERMDFSAYDFTLPVVVLMMEDGAIEWFYADPYMAEDNKGYGEEYDVWENFQSSRLLAKVEGTFSYEPDNEGIGNKTIYVTKEQGLKSDFYYLWLETMVFSSSWACELNDEWPIYGNFNFEDNGYFYFDVGEGEDSYPVVQSVYENWEGNAEIITAVDQDYPLGTFVFDMWVTWWIDECVEGDCDNEKLARVSGSYRIDVVGSDGSITLYYNEGDDLYQQNKDWKVFNLFEVLVGQ